MANPKKELTAKELIESHLPKKISKYRVIVKDAELFEALKEDPEFDMNKLDTINNIGLIDAGYNSTDFTYYPRDIVIKAKEPTTVDKDACIVIGKQLITKTDKKLQEVGYAKFTYNDVNYVMIKFVYEKFDIVEVFLLI